MKQQQKMKLPDNYRPFILVVLLFIGIKGISQTYNPSSCCTVSNKAYGMAQSGPTDGRSYYYDGTNFVYRYYQSTNEVLTYLNLPKYRAGNFSIWINFGGILNSNGTWTGGVVNEYYFRNGTADSNLVAKSTTIDTTALMRKANNLSDVVNVPSARTNLGLGSMSVLNSTAGGDLSGIWPNVTVSFFNGQLPSYYLNYNNLTNKPVGLSLTTSGTSGPATYNSGTGILNIPNYAVSGGGACLNCNADTLGNIPAVFSAFPQNGQLVLDSINGIFFIAPKDSIWRTPGVDSIFFTIQGRRHSILDSAGGGSGSGITQLTGDGTAGPGSGSQVFTLATVNANVGSFGDASHVSTFTVNGKGLLTAAGQTLIQIAESQVTNLTTDLAGKQASLSGTGYLKFAGTTPSYLTPTQVTADLNQFTTSLQGLVPASGGGTTNFLRADGTWAAPPGGGGSGTVTSVAQTVPSSFLTISGSPITTSGTLAIGLATASANSIWGNNTGSTATPAYFVPTSTTLNGWFGSTIQSAITLTTTGTSGAATLVGSTLNIPQYTTGSSIPPNIGLGFRVYSPQVPGFKTIFAGTNVTIDSTTNTNGLTISAAGSGGLTPQANHTYLGVSNLTGSTAIPTAVTQPFYMATDYGIVGDSATDNTTAIQNLINFVPAGSVIFFPAGKYITTGKLTITKSITIQGTEGGIGNINTAAFPFACAFYHTNNSDTAFYVSSTGVQFIGMALVYPGGTAATSASRGIYGDNFKNGGLTHIQVMGFNVNFEVKNGGEWRATQGCFFKNAVTYNMVIQNAGNHDDGDQLIDNCYFSSESTNSAGSSHINYISGGGLRITNSKFNALSGSFAKNCIDVPFVGTVDFFVQNNSFENFTGRAINIIPTGSLTEMYITGNEFDEHQTSSGAAFIYIDGSTGSASSYLAVINDNGFNGANTTDTAIYLNGLTHASVGDGNVYRQIPNRLILGSTIGLSDVSATFNPLVQAPTNTTLKHTTDGQGGNVTNISITGTDTIAISNPVVGREMAFQITQDATGGRQAVLPANWANLPQNNPVLSGTIRLNLDTRAGAQTLVTGYVNAAKGFTITNVQRAYTNGSIAYYANGFVEDNSNLFYDATTHSLLLGTTTANAKSILTMNSTTQGFLPPRMTTTQINAITSQPEGLMYYDNVNHAYYFWNGTAVTPFASLSNPMTTQYDIIYGGVGGVPTRLAAGANGTFLGVSGGVLGYYTPSGSIGGLTTNQVVKATSATSIGSSNISDDGTTIKIIAGTSGVYASYFGVSGTINRFRAAVNQFNDSSGYAVFGSGSQVNSCILCTVGDVNINGALWIGSSSATTGFKITTVGATTFLDSKATNGTSVVRSNANSVTNITFNADGSSTLFTPTSTAPSLVLPAGTKPTTMSQGWLAAATGHLWYHDGSTDYDLLAGGGGAVSSVSNSDGTLTISPTTGAVVASLALGHANTWSALQTFGSLTSTGITKFTGLTSAGANDSVATIDPATGTMHWKSGTFNLTFNNGLTASGTTVSLGGTLIQNTSIGGNFSLSFGTPTGLTSFNVVSSVISLSGSINLSQPSVADANLTVSEGGYLYDLGLITANRTIALPSASTDAGRIIRFTVSNSAAFTWAFSSTVQDLLGNTITTLSNGSTYDIESRNSQWIVVNVFSPQGNPIRYRHTIFTPTTGGTVALVNNQYNIINPAGSLAALTVNLPSSPVNNDVVYIKYTQTISLVTYGNGTVVDGITAPVAGGLVVLTYDATTASWY